MCIFDTDLVVVLLVNCGAIFCSLLAIASLATNTSKEQSLRTLLISFVVSNASGSCIFVFGVVRYVCHSDVHPLDFVVTICMVLSFTHILLLILHYYIVITSTKTKKASEFVGLIVTGWITSAAIGSMIFVSKEHSVGHVAVLVGFVVVSCIALKSYHYVLMKHRNRENIQIMYRQKYLSLEGANLGRKEPGLWNLTYLAIMLVSHIVFSVPWLTTEIMLFHGNTGHLGHSISLTIYAVNFYVPSLICIVMRGKEYRGFSGKQNKTRHKKPSMALEDSYRLRSLYSPSAHSIDMI